MSQFTDTDHTLLKQITAGKVDYDAATGLWSTGADIADRDTQATLDRFHTLGLVRRNPHSWSGDTSVTLTALGEQEANR